MKHWRPLAAVLGVLAVAVAAGIVSVRGSSSSPAVKVTGKGIAALGGLRERGGAPEDEGGAAAQAYTDRAYPADDITIEQIQGAIAADKAVKNRGSKLSKRWDFLGPETLDVDRLGNGTQTWSRLPTACRR